VTDVKIHDSEGQVVDLISLSDDVTYISDRVSRSTKGYYYKGIGVPYSCHFIKNFTQAGFTEKIENPNWKGKTGIFQSRYQPYFSDFIGSCGPKELKLIPHSQQFERASVRVLDCVEYDKENNQRYFIVDYDCGRQRYLNGGDPHKLGELIDYMIFYGWNFPWDKTAINDITYDGRVSDVADMFQSKNPIHRFGTVYSILYSLDRLDFQKYQEFVGTVHLKHSGDIDFPMLALALLDKNGIDVNVLLPKTANDNFQIYEYLVGQKLIQGNNCAHVEDKAYGDKVTQQYIEIFKNRGN